MLGIDITKEYEGLNEVKNNGSIKSLLRSKAVKGDIDIDPAKESWCSAWMNFTERSVGHKTKGSLMARSWEDYGEKVELKDIKRGDILVFDFEHNGINGHVTYFDREKLGGVVCLGGNQSNNIQESFYSKENIIAIRRSV